MKKIRAFIVDDEEAARENLRYKVEKHIGHIDIIGEAEGADEAIYGIKELKPDLVFLDIAMPNKSGFDLLEEIGEIDFEIIFVTAFDEYAIRAFEYCALGYLLKPIDNELLINAVEYVFEKMMTRNIASPYINFLNHMQNIGAPAKLGIPTENGIDFIHPNDIVIVEASEGYSEFKLKEGHRKVSSRSLSYFYKLLPSERFFQVHRSYVVNINYIISYRKSGHVTMENGEEIPVARNRRAEFVNRFK